MTVAIIGAGMAGLSCARPLVQAGLTVEIYDKGRGPGGRMSTRRVTVEGRGLRFDHGAQYFTARDERFRAEVAAWQQAGRVAPWPAAGDEALVGVPGMNEPVRAMAEGLDVGWGARIDRLDRVAGEWMLHGDGLLESHSTVVVAVPAEQAGPLVAGFSPQFGDRAERTVSEPCWTVMACFAQPLPLPDTLATGDSVAWAARDGAKPGRSGSESWVLQARRDGREIGSTKLPTQLPQSCSRLSLPRMLSPRSRRPTQPRIAGSMPERNRSRESPRCGIRPCGWGWWATGCSRRGWKARGFPGVNWPIA
ncbi:NAD(P)-binding protein [Qipengyuania sp. DY56-A-20]|jgi:predicted NAD/FAD-dependent oxidoreductase|uniref:NAD(P)-binding protein n=1 Tax=Qipengyuania benthica TaxID=3067651 RepID=A0ABT9H946_9SPHN|nr:FAD-dependent oxidoreductase [Qipengyuania sp. DY56-A-20]MDP4539786.1 NAD(P)-binding protein [Qipengyuania sp. DY56-A-20]